jgi:YesN/AraC family two-component response regulator
MFKINTKALNHVMRIFYNATKSHLVILDASSTPVYYYPPRKQSVFKAQNISAYRRSHPVRCIQIESSLPCYSILYTYSQISSGLFEEEDLKLLLKIFCSYACSEKYIFEYHSSQSEEIERYISSHLGEDLSAQKLSDVCHIAKNNVYKTIKSATGQSLGAFIRTRRISHAKHLLLQTDLPVAEIAEQCGMLDNNYFSYLFKKDCGISPSAYRHLHDSLSRQI